MIVVDASALVDLIIGHDPTGELARWADFDSQWVAPEHVLIEVMSGLRGNWLAGRLDDNGFAAAQARLEVLGLLTYPTEGLLPRIAELAANATPYDAAYVALAERLKLPLLTADAKLARIPGITCRVIGPLSASGEFAWR